MRLYIENWLILLRDAQPAYGLPLVLVGLVLMFMGYQLHRIAVPFTFLLLGLILGQVAFEPMSDRLIAGAAAGLVLAVVSFLTMRYAVALISGLAAAAIAAAYQGAIAHSLLPVVQWSITAFAFVAASALSFISFREMVIAMTSLVGALLLVSGLNGILPQSAPSLYDTISGFLVDYPAFLAPFLVGAPTLIAILVQLANSTRRQTAPA